MASNFRIVLTALGLKGLQVLRYSRAQGQQAQAGSSAEYPAQEGGETSRMITEGADAAPLSYLGTPVFADVQFPNPEAETVKLETVLIEVNQQKLIEVTAVQGRPGTIKEYIADGDYEISIRGALVEPFSDSYPFDQVRAMHQLLLRSEAIEVVSEYLRLFEIYSIVVTGYRFFQQPGFQNMQLFEITALSDRPVELIGEDDVPA